MKFIDKKRFFLLTTGNFGIIIKQSIANFVIRGIMKKTITVVPKDPVITMADGIVYAQRTEWCDAVVRQLKLSIIRPRQFFSYDRRVKWPVIIWICGGGFTTLDRNVWAPELAWFAKQGYIIASVDYSVIARTRFPEQIEEIKEAIRFLRTHGEEYGIDPERFAVMGESAGGYLSALTGLTGKTKEYDKGTNLDKSSAVQAVVSWYPLTEPDNFECSEEMALLLPRDLDKYPNLIKLVDRDAPPFLILHGNTDTQVQVSHGEKLYEALNKAGVDSELVILNGAEHADEPFVQDEIKQLIIKFLNRCLK
jgi:acetyl esterase/lipase